MIFERAGRHKKGRGSLNGMIFISLLFHAGIISLLFFTPSFPSPKLTFGPVYTVALVNFSARSLEQKRVSAGAKELMDTARSETALKKRVATQPDIPIRSLESHKKQDRTLEKAMEEIRRRAAASGPTPKPQAQAQAGPVTKAGPDAKAGTSSPMPAGDADMNAKINAYYATIWSRIKRGWALPQGILPGDVLETVIDVTILRSGAVAGMNFEKRSGSSFFDESALKAIRKASPFPPLPDWFGGTSLDVGIRFHSSELKS